MTALRWTRQCGTERGWSIAARIGWLVWAAAALWGLIASGGCSPAISQWSDRGEAGLAAGTANMQALGQFAAKLLDEREDSAIGDYSDDLRSRRDKILRELTALAMAADKEAAAKTVSVSVPVPTPGAEPAANATTQPATQPAAKAAADAATADAATALATVSSTDPSAIIEKLLSDQWIAESDTLLRTNLATVRSQRSSLREFLDTDAENSRRTRECFTAIRSLNKAWTGAGSETAVQIARIADAIVQMRAEQAAIRKQLAAQAAAEK